MFSLLAFQLGGYKVAALALHQGENASCSRLSLNGVAFPVAEPLPACNDGRTLINADAVISKTLPSAVSTLFSPLFALATEMPIESPVDTGV